MDAQTIDTDFSLILVALTHALTHSLTHSVTHSLTHSLTHAITHSLSLSLTGTVMSLVVTCMLRANRLGHTSRCIGTVISLEALIEKVIGIPLLVFFLHYPLTDSPTDSLTDSLTH